MELHDRFYHEELKGRYASKLMEDYAELFVYSLPADTIEEVVNREMDKIYTNQEYYRRFLDAHKNAIAEIADQDYQEYKGRMYEEVKELLNDVQEQIEKSLAYVYLDEYLSEEDIEILKEIGLVDDELVGDFVKDVLRMGLENYLLDFYEETQANLKHVENYLQKLYEDVEKISKDIAFFQEHRKYLEYTLKVLPSLLSKYKTTEPGL